MRLFSLFLAGVERFVRSKRRNSVLLETLAKKFNWSKFEPFIMPIAMFGAMGMAVLLTKTLPADIVQWTWWS